MRILHVCNHFYPCIGGVENYVYDLCKNLKRLGHTSDVLCVDKCPYSDKRLPRFEEHENIKIYRTGAANLKFYNVSPIPDILGGYDIIHIHAMGFFLDYLVLTKFMHRKRIVLSTHGGIFHTRSIYPVKRLYFDMIARVLLKFVDKVFADGESDRKLFSRISSGIAVVPITIDVPEFSRVARRPRKNTLLFVGRVSKNKRVDNLIRTIYYVKKSLPDVKLYIIGKDWEGLVRGLKKLAHENGLDKNVVFVGPVSRKGLLKYLGESKLYVFASEYEGGSVISVLEAMAAGCPVVVNKGIKDTCKDFVIEGRTGFFVDYNNPESAAETIARLLGRDLSGVEKRGKEMSKRYDWPTVSKRIERLYMGVLKG
jgi:alpha-1,3-mannosyltransferase